MDNTFLIGPFKQLLTLQNLPIKGALRDDDLEILDNGGLYVKNGLIEEVGNWGVLNQTLSPDIQRVTIDENSICLPSYIDCHTHIAFGGNRANDFAMRNAGRSYLEIAESGGGIWSTVQHTRACSQEEQEELILERAYQLLQQGITTIEVKSGYGLSIEEELKTLRAIQKAHQRSSVDLIATCLAAHIKPKDFDGTSEQYLQKIAHVLFPILQAENLCHRIDAFVEKSAFSTQEILPYLQKAQALGFDITLHADQFTTSGSQVAINLGALSADHLEASGDIEIQNLANSDVVAVALPAASLGLGCDFTPARKLLDAGASLAIATDWNPGSAPMGQLITSASILATMQKLSNAEILAGITFRAAKALGLADRGRLQKGYIADFVLYQTNHYQQIIYQQGRLQPSEVWKNGQMIFNK